MLARKQCNIEPPTRGSKTLLYCKMQKNPDQQRERYRKGSELVSISLGLWWPGIWGLGDKPETLMASQNDSWNGHLTQQPLISPTSLPCGCWQLLSFNPTVPKQDSRTIISTDQRVLLFSLFKIEVLTIQAFVLKTILSIVGGGVVPQVYSFGTVRKKKGKPFSFW